MMRQSNSVVLRDFDRRWEPAAVDLPAGEEKKRTQSPPPTATHVVAERQVNRRRRAHRGRYWGGAGGGFTNGQIWMWNEVFFSKFSTFWASAQIWPRVGPLVQGEQNLNFQPKTEVQPWVCPWLPLTETAIGWTLPSVPKKSWQYSPRVNWLPATSVVVVGLLSRRVP